MGTLVHEPIKIDPKDIPGGGSGGFGNITPDGGRRATLDYSPGVPSSAIWVGLFAIFMMFAAFTSALIVRKGGSTDWESFVLPSMLYVDTFLLLVSSATLEVGRRKVDAFMRGLKVGAERPTFWLYATLVLGLLFVLGQYIAWNQLRASGLYLATNPSSSFFYVLTAAHALHVLGGLIGLVYVIHKLRRLTLRRNALVSAVRYWHFMGVLWIYLMVLLWVKV